ncbi:type II secretion system F family protein [Burkholderia thailandensis]|uniref:Type II secretion system (T2SS), F family protein n=7 Tax=pseudomallei group TaxID=111527 RepID=A0AAW9D778_BURTH|nr:type II secretion system F family protein [Burkholderia thailandensis]ABC37602.1 membrane protein, putative [Burkholderia thailandensis E264]AHI64646.1 type II secretion system (T2SS), F family protein [Burkholderia thailandensis H0587]AHI74074.1 type II secretion system (T2SS), F family protein [Burkholderia thailandensis 2002721723]AHI78150.1 type II secretion system (T2SS), F family protein [Burkholderia thailandensis E444]AIC85954.1 type II secretion system (T2SS), F family protein [Bur
MSSAALWALALALLCVAGALALWRRGEANKERAHAARYIDSRLEPGARPGAQPKMPAAAEPKRAAAPMPAAGAAGGAPAAKPAEGLARWRERVADAWLNVSNRAGVSEIRTPLVALGAVTAFATLWAGLRGGLLAAVAAFVAGATLVVFWLASRMQKRRLRIVRQLPSFLDGIVRLVTLGNSVPAAFQATLQTTDAPLRGCLDHVSRMLRSGVEIDRAMVYVAALYRIKEFELVGSVLRLSVKYGGRADVMLDRMAVFMRDLEQAERELVAMSAETRLSAWVLGALPVGIGSFVIATNPKYFSAMWLDPMGRQLVYLAFILQVAGGYWLYRLARLR